MEDTLGWGSCFQLVPGQVPVLEDSAASNVNTSVQTRVTAVTIVPGSPDLLHREHVPQKKSESVSRLLRLFKTREDGCVVTEQRVLGK